LRRSRTIVALAALGLLGLGAGLFVALRARSLHAPSAGLQEPPFRAAAVLGTRTPTGWAKREATVSCDGHRRIVRLAPDGAGRGQVVAEPAQTLNWRALERSYDVSTREGPVVAERPTKETLVTRKGSAVPAVTLYRDTETGAVLRRESYRYDGALASRTELTSVDYGAPVSEPGPAPVPIAAEGATGERTSREAVRESVGFTPAPPTHAPEGYRLDGLYGYASGHGRGYAEYRYSDGLRSLSIYERVPGGWASGSGPGAHGRGRGQGNGRGGPPEVGRAQVTDIGIAITARQRRGGMVVVVIGDVSPDEAVRVLESVPPKR